MKEEYLLQKTIVDYIRDNYPKIVVFCVPNEAAHVAHHAPGILKGAPDLILVLPEKVVFLELKSTNGRLSDQQCLFKTKVELLGVEYHIIRDLIDVKDILKNNLPLEEWFDL